MKPEQDQKAAQAAQSGAQWRAIDLYEWARREQTFESSVALGALSRVAEMLPTDAPADARQRSVHFTAQAGTARDATGVRPMLALRIQGETWLQCQVCLSGFAFPIDIEAHYRIVASEEDADAIPLDDDGPDPIVGAHEFDLLDLIDEEIVLALPMVPQHEVCPEQAAAPAAGQADAPEEAPAKPNPFAALAGLVGGAGKKSRH